MISEEGKLPYLLILPEKINDVADDIKTFSDKKVKDYRNFLCSKPRETSKFYKYIAKKEGLSE